MLRGVAWLLVRPWRPVLLAAVTIAFAGGTSCFAGDPTSRMDQVVQSYVNAEQFMGAVLVARGDEIVFNKAYGFADLEWNIPNTSTTKFRIGSLTKQFTAASILLLEERGKLEVDDPIRAHFAGAPTAWDKITIFHLLTHSAGIPNITSFPDYGALKLSATSVDKTVQRLLEEPLEFRPGEQMKYSNSGYLLLGAVVEKVSGMSYEKFLQENIFTPLGMKDSGHDSNSAIIPRRASGYASSPNGPVNAAFIDMSFPHGAGGLYSTTEDLLRWERGLFENKLLSAASLQRMTTPFKGGYAFGLMISTTAGRKAIQHDGGIDGFNSGLAYYPEGRITVVALANLNGQTAWEIVRQLGALAHGDQVRPAPSEGRSPYWKP